MRARRANRNLNRKHKENTEYADNIDKTYINKPFDMALTAYQIIRKSLHRI